MYSYTPDEKSSNDESYMVEVKLWYATQYYSRVCDKAS